LGKLFFQAVSFLDINCSISMDNLHSPGGKSLPRFGDATTD
jgi:hypothetical protein